MNQFRIYAFADEAGEAMQAQVAAMLRNGLNGLEIRNVDGENVSSISVEKAKERKLLPFAVIMVIACLMHQVALVFIPMYLLLRLNVFRKDKKMIVLPIIFMIVFSPLIIRFGQFLSDDVYAAETAKFSFNGIVPILIYSITIIGHIGFVRNRGVQANVSTTTKHKDTFVGFSMTAIGLGLYFLRFYNMVLERVSFCFIQGAPVALADLVGYFKRDRYGRIVEMVIIVLCFILFLHRLNNASYANYIFFWETA